MKTLNLLWIIIIIEGAFGCKHPEPETYLIPDGFKGRVNVIFNQSKGTPPKYENGRRIYQVPTDGILLSQFKDEYGLIDHQYFYSNQNGSKMPLRIFQYEHNKDGTIKWIISDTSAVGIFLDGTTGSYGNENIKYQEFIVASYSNLNNFFRPIYQDDFEKKVQQILKTAFVPDTLSAPKMKEVEQRLNQNNKSK
jgi:hypothetical protein